MSDPSGYDDGFWERLRAEVLGHAYRESVDEFQRRNAGPSRPTGGRRVSKVDTSNTRPYKPAKFESIPSANTLSNDDIVKWLKEPPDWSST